MLFLREYNIEAGFDGLRRVPFTQQTEAAMIRETRIILLLQLLPCILVFNIVIDLVLLLCCGVCVLVCCGVWSWCVVESV